MSIRTRFDREEMERWKSASPRDQYRCHAPRRQWEAVPKGPDETKRLSFPGPGEQRRPSAHNAIEYLDRRPGRHGRYAQGSCEEWVKVLRYPEHYELARNSSCGNFRCAQYEAVVPPACSTMDDDGGLVEPSRRQSRSPVSRIPRSWPAS
jgi:hypothetical protein